ncbi:hypothetical protein O181_039347 [Austropuccinia psidii MF-1]|uniref:Uncharacterized protein n=1 Tax=Austropuccinia psidii MF-1 TaxID=1389203 RepID=A0A9Q3HCU2_9BASI|nr:hypothetical protein [Austropuccinia psidii MF-1]
MASIDGKEKHDAFNSIMEEKNPPPPKKGPKTAPVASSHNSNVKASHKLRTRKKEKTQPAIQNFKYSAVCHGKCFSDGQNNDGMSEKGGSQTKISEIISHILAGIPNLYIAINDVKSHISDKNSAICNNLKTNNLSLSQINETLMCFERVLRTIKTSNNNNSFVNKLNEQYSNIKESTDKYSKFNIDDIIETRIEQAICIIKEDNK